MSHQLRGVADMEDKGDQAGMLDEGMRGGEEVGRLRASLDRPACITRLRKRSGGATHQAADIIRVDVPVRAPRDPRGVARVHEECRRCYESDYRLLINYVAQIAVE